VIFFFIVSFIGFLKQQNISLEEEISEVIEEEVNKTFKEETAVSLKNTPEPKAKENTIEKYLTNLPLAQNSPEISPSDMQTFLSEFEILQKEINDELFKLTNNLYPNPEKSLSKYQQEISALLKKVVVKQNQQLDYRPLVNLAKSLANIQPPPILFSFHKELIRIYLSAGLTLKKAEQTEDPIKKFLLYNMVNNILNEIKI
jgi:hypothetical protein